MNFWLDLLSNGIATFLGAGLGVLGALWLSSYQERRHEKERKGRILKAIRTELEINQKELINLVHELEHDKGETFFLSLLRVETWRTFSDGGELEWIKDPDLLNNLADVYFSLKQVNFVSEKFFEEIQTYAVSRNSDVLHGIEMQRHSIGDLVADTQRKIEDILKLI